MRYLLLFLSFTSVIGLNCTDYYGIKKCNCSIGDKLNDFEIRRNETIALTFPNGSIFSVVNLPYCYVTDTIISNTFVMDHLDDLFHPINKTNSSNNTV